MELPRWFVVGLMFNDDLSKVCLIRKNRPDWQAGKLNGIGGKIEKGELAFEAMVREFYEETGVLTNISMWKHFLTLRFPNAIVEFFTGKDSNVCEAIKTLTDEEVVKIAVGDNLLQGYPQLIENIPAVTRLAIQALTECEGFSYKNK